MQIWRIDAQHARCGELTLFRADEYEARIELALLCQCDWDCDVYRVEAGDVELELLENGYWPCLPLGALLAMAARRTTLRDVVEMCADIDLWNESVSLVEE